MNIHQRQRRKGIGRSLRIETLEFRLPLDSSGFLPICYADEPPATSDSVNGVVSKIPVLGPSQAQHQDGLPEWFGRAHALTQNSSASPSLAEFISHSKRQDRVTNSSGIFARFDGIAGDATDINHVGWIEVLNVDHGYSSLEASSQDLALSELVLMVEPSKVSPEIAEALLAGTVFPTFDLHFTSTFQSGREIYLDYELEDVVVTSYDLIAGRSEKPLETISLKFAELDVVFKELDTTGQVQRLFPYKYRTTEPQVADSSGLASSINENLRANELSHSSIAYAKFDGIEGEVSDADHLDWINIISVDHGYRRVGDLRAGDTHVSELVLVTENSKASPEIADSLLNGANIRTLDLHFTTTSENGHEVFLDYELSDVRVTSYDLIAGSTEIPIEVISVSFEELKIEYLVRGSDGNVQSTTPYRWSIEQTAPRSELPLAVSVATNLRNSESARHRPAFARFDGIAGDVTDANHVDWMEVLSVDHGYASLDPSSRAPLLTELVLVTETSKASPKIAEALLRGTVFPKFDLHFTSTFSGGREVFLDYQLQNVVVTSYDMISGRGEIPLETISLKFQELDIEYRELDIDGQIRRAFPYRYRTSDPLVADSLGLASLVADKRRGAELDTFSVAYAQMSGVVGDVKDANHVGWVNVISVDHGYKRFGDIRSGGVSASELVMVIDNSKASPQIADALLRGTRMQTLDLHFTSTNGVGRQVYLDYELSDVRITSYDLIAGSSGVLLEAISVSFEDVKVEHFMLGSDGGIQPTTQYDWDFDQTTQRGELPLAASIADNVRNSESMRSSPAFARFEGIAGDAIDEDHVGWMEVLTIDHGYSSLGPPNQAPTLSELVLVAETSQASQEIADALLLGRVFPKFDLHFTSDTSDGRQVFLDYQFDNVVVTSYDLAAGRGDANALEIISVKFEKLDVVYREFGVDGRLQGMFPYHYRSPEPQIAESLSLASSIASNLRENDSPPLGPIFARFDGIQGDVIDAHYLGWVNVLSVDHGYTRFGDIRNGNLNISELVIATETSKASPAIADALLRGTNIEIVELNFATISQSGLDIYLAYELRDVRIVSYDLISGPSGRLQEVISVEFDSLTPTRPALYPRVDSVFVNDGTVQRSIVDQLIIDFSDVVTNADDAFRVTPKERPDAPIEIDVQWSAFNGNSIAVVSFPGSPVSLGDGEYLLTIDGSKIRSVASGRLLDGAGDGSSGSLFEFGEVAADGFFRLFGDSDGDRDVDGQDYGRFGGSFLTVAGDPDYRSVFDWDGDGDVDGRDYGGFGANFLTSLGG